MKVKVYNLEGKETGEQIDLADSVFNVELKPTVVHQVFTQLSNNQREPWADTKGKGEVRGGGRKPWRQKGTGRARHGSIRSPIWKGGGVAFGPKTERNYRTKINKKIRRLAIKMCLSDKVRHENFLIVEDFSFLAPKTKLFAQLVKALPQRRSLLVLTSGKNEMVRRMAKNLPRVSVSRAGDANVMTLLAHEAILTSKDGAAKVEEVFSKN